MDGSDDDAVGSWTPEPAVAPDLAMLRRLAVAWHQHSETLLDVLCAGPAAEPHPAAEAAATAPSMRALTAGARAAMQQPRGALDAPAAALDAADLEALIRLFTLLEARPGWEAGAASPVVPLFRALRTRARSAPDAADTDALAAWVKGHSDNRFLPWGSLQDRLRG